MKKLMTSITVGLLCFGIVGCASTPVTNKPEETNTPTETPEVTPEVVQIGEYTKGILDGNSFESEFIGIRLEAPSGYFMATQDELDAMMAGAFEEVGSDFSEEQLDYAKISTVYEMLITSSNGVPNIIMAAEKLPLANMDIDMYLGAFKNQISQISSVNTTIEEEGITAEIAGQEYKGLVMVTSTEGTEVYQKALCRKVGDRVVTLMISYLPGTEAQVEELLNAFQPY